MIYDILPVNNHAGNGTNKEFDFDFYIENENQLKVYLFDKNKFKYELINNVDYSINEVKNKNGSYITFPLESSEFEVLKEGENIVLELSLPISQETQYNNSSLLNLEALEYSLDYLTRLIQIISRKMSLCLQMEECSELSPKEMLDDIESKASFVKVKAEEIAKNFSEAQQIFKDIDKKTKSNLNKTQITDCILEAPNGVAELSDSNITVKNGLKILFSNGRNSDGSFKNKEITLNNNINFTDSLRNQTRIIVLYSADNGQTFKAAGRLMDCIFNQNETPTIINTTVAQQFWYKPIENIWYRTTDTGATWNPAIVCKLGSYYISSTDSSLTNLIPSQPVELAKKEDVKDILSNCADKSLTNLTSGLSNTICTTIASTTSSATSQKPAVVVENYLSSTSWYRVWSDGWIEQGGTQTLNNSQDMTLHYLKPFSNAYYTITCAYLSSVQRQDPLVITNKTAESFTVSNSAGSGTAVVSWYACGY